MSSKPFTIKSGVKYPRFLLEFMVGDRYTSAPEISLTCTFTPGRSFKIETMIGYNAVSANLVQQQPQILKKICRWVVLKELSLLSESDKRRFLQFWGGRKIVIALRRSVLPDYQIPWHRDGLKGVNGHEKVFMIGGMYVNIPPSLVGGNFEILVGNEFHKQKVKTGDCIVFFDDDMFHRVTPLQVSDFNRTERSLSMMHEGRQYIKRTAIFTGFFTPNVNREFVRGLTEVNRANRDYFRMFREAKSYVNGKKATINRMRASGRNVQGEINNSRTGLAKILYENLRNGQVSNKNKANAEKLYNNMKTSFSALNERGNIGPGARVGRSRVTFKVASPPKKPTSKVRLPKIRKGTGLRPQTVIRKKTMVKSTKRILSPPKNNLENRLNTLIRSMSRTGVSRMNYTD
jgi:hypothetical protein